MSMLRSFRHAHESQHWTVLRRPAAAPPRKRKRKPNATRYIKQARKAGECGPVRVEVIDQDDNRIIVTSSNQPTADLMSQDDAEALWKARLSNAAH